jgi:NitT/TauT family transport system substrate-binding protein
VVPYSRAVGGLLAPAASGVTALPDLAGGKIGIAGGPLDKSWLILRAYAQEVHGMDLAAETEQVFGAPPLIFKSGLSGDLQGAVNYWHFLAKMRAAGMVEVISVAEAGRALGLDPDTPLLGYYFKERFLEAHPGLAQAFYDASRAAKTRLAEDPAAWQALRPMMNAASEAEFEALRQGWIAGIPARGPVDAEAAGRFLALMHRLGGAALVGRAERLPEGLFVALD